MRKQAIEIYKTRNDFLLEFLRRKEAKKQGDDKITFGFAVFEFGDFASIDLRGVIFHNCQFIMPSLFSNKYIIGTSFEDSSFVEGVLLTPDEHFIKNNGLFLKNYASRGFFIPGSPWLYHCVELANIYRQRRTDVEPHEEHKFDLESYDNPADPQKITHLAFKMLYIYIGGFPQENYFICFKVLNEFIAKQNKKYEKEFPIFKVALMTEIESTMRKMESYYPDFWEDVAPRLKALISLIARAKTLDEVLLFALYYLGGFKESGESRKGLVASCSCVTQVDMNFANANDTTTYNTFWNAGLLGGRSKEKFLSECYGDKSAIPKYVDDVEAILARLKASPKNIVSTDKLATAEMALIPPLSQPSKAGVFSRSSSSQSCSPPPERPDTPAPSN